jgi:hypothetical protein
MKVHENFKFFISFSRFGTSLSHFWNRSSKQKKIGCMQ